MCLESLGWERASKDSPFTAQSMGHFRLHVSSRGCQGPGKEGHEDTGRGGAFLENKTFLSDERAHTLISQISFPMTLICKG